MDVIREQLIYKNTPTTICFGKLTPQEQYECIRLILATRMSEVSICTHDIENPYLTGLIKDLNVKFIQCWLEELKHQVFDLHRECK